MVAFILLDCTAPFRVAITTNAVADGDDDDTTVASRGTCLEYNQRPC